KSIIKLETNHFLIKNSSLEFNNIDEAKNSPLAQQLFHLPFVKKIYISSNFIAVERYDIVEWKDVQDEVASQVEEYLNNGGVVVEEESKSKVPITIYAESTPNPSVMKFVANKKIAIQSIEFKNIDDAKHAPLAQQLFHFPFVKEIFLDENYVSITKYDMAEWNDIVVELREFIKSHIEEGKEIINTEHAPETSSEAKSRDANAISFENLDDISKQIVAILDEYIKPAVQSDGGNIMFQSYDKETKKVKVILQGACNGCPSSTFTLKNGIENMLKEMLQDEKIHVEAING
ncbi:MAG: NifU family protein, partial [Flavobacteriaceae bacterium]|nr:NifU family protein [Flavobacteriaceae bacterium]